ncbi:MAG: RND transporter [Oceanospirillaceae bacterium]|nr:RND transporter [Oceanospirillaceae bacterium]
MALRRGFFRVRPSAVRLKVVGALVLTSLLAGCSGFSTRTDYREPVVSERDALGNNLASKQEAVNPATATVSLSELLDDSQLADLISKSLQANPGLQQTLYTLKQARAQARVTAASRLPDADLGFSGQRTEASDDRFTAEVSVSWELDLWSKLDDSHAAALADVAQQEALFQSARDSLVASLIDAWLTLIHLNKSLQVQQQRVEALEQNHQSTVQRYRTGIGSVDDLDSARSSLASARSTLADDQYQLAEARRTLRGLVGVATDGELQALGFSLADEFPTVAMPVAELPEQTLERRPDLQAAWHGLEAAEFSRDVAYKDMLPSLSLTAAYSDSATSPSEALFQNPLWSLLGQLSAPLFRGGELKANAQKAEYAVAEAAQSYRETLLTAVTEVENALDKERALVQRMSAIDVALGSARDNESRYVLRYRAGLASLRDLLNVKQSRLDLEDSAHSLQYQHLSNRISLGLALGLPGVRSYLDSSTLNVADNSPVEETLK